MSDLRKEIGTRIKEARNKRNISQQACADMLGISTTHLSDIENGKSNFSVEILKKISEMLQVSADWILQTNILGTDDTSSKEVTLLLEDCTPAESKVLLRTMKEMKELIISKR